MKLPENQQDFSTYQPHVWSVKKDTIYAAITALDLGLKYASDCLATNPMTTPGHRLWAETTKSDIKQMEDALKALRSEGTERNSATTTSDQDHAANNQSYDDLKKMYNDSGELLGAWNRHSADSIRKMYEGVSEAMIKELDSMIRKAITIHLGTENWNLEEVTKRAALLLYEGTKITAVTLDGKPILFYGEPTFNGKGFTRKYHVIPKPEDPIGKIADTLIRTNLQVIHDSIKERSELDTDSNMTGKSPAEPTPATNTQHPSVGDYVLATKYTDGDPMDPWFIGFYSGPTTHTPPKYTITDVKGTPFSRYSFRKIKKITQKQGEWMLKNRELIQHSGMPVWHFTQLPEESLQ